MAAETRNNHSLNTNQPTDNKKLSKQLGHYFFINHLRNSFFCFASSTTSRLLRLQTHSLMCVMECANG